MSEDLDLENGTLYSPADPKDCDNIGEYDQLVKYISTYRDVRKAAAQSDEDGAEIVMKRIWYAPWKKRPVRQTKMDKKSGEPFVAPDEWLHTDIKRGLASSEVEARRAKTGWNEITSETENMFIKFLMYFTGPILYGTHLTQLR